MAVDWKFIGTLEGAGILKGYVPVSQTSNSGVTIATGVDLGQATTAEIDGWGIDDSLKAKLKPYCGLQKQAAVDFLAANPLVITPDECEQIDSVVEAEYAARVAATYNASAHMAFANLPDRAQTVIVSVAFQYGTGLAKACPKFWAAAIVQNWAGMVHELQNFGDQYTPRRLKEANYLMPILSPAAQMAPLSV
jgi:Bacterial toxin homologue of phage lysozyme, C-term